MWLGKMQYVDNRKARPWPSFGELVDVKENRLMSSRSSSCRGGGGACDHVI